MAEFDWIDDDTEDEGPDLDGIGCGPVETSAETFRLQAEAMLAEGFSKVAVLAGMQQAAAEFGWELAEEAGE